MIDQLDDAAPPIDFTAPLTATGNLRRRQAVNVGAEAGATLAALLALVVLGIVVASVVRRGGGAISIDFLTKSPPLFGGPGGGIAPAIVGTAIIVALATLIATPIAVLTAIFITEFASPRVAGPIRLALDMLNGLPSIVIGVFVFGLLVAGHHQSGFAGSFALAIIMLPLIARASQEVLLLVPRSLREASLALGVSRWRTVLSIVLPAARGGIITGTTLAVARAAGETAPLLFTSSLASSTTTDANPLHPLFSLTEVIFIYFDTGDPSKVAKAWGAAFLLMMFVLITSLSAKLLLARTRRKLGS
ncbi:MAG: phosphate ABC transporter permease PstA [Gaiellaceae bacterium]